MIAGRPAQTSRLALRRCDPARADAASRRRIARPPARPASESPRLAEPRFAPRSSRTTSSACRRSSKPRHPGPSWRPNSATLLGMGAYVRTREASSRCSPSHELRSPRRRRARRYAAGIARSARTSTGRALARGVVALMTRAQVAPNELWVRRARPGSGSGSSLRRQQQHRIDLRLRIRDQRLRLAVDQLIELRLELLRHVIEQRRRLGLEIRHVRGRLAEHILRSARTAP